MKRIFAFFLSFLLILGICPMSALADTGGSGNVAGGGGSMGQGTSQKLRLLYACTGYAPHYQQRQYQGKY